MDHKACFSVPQFSTLRLVREQWVTTHFRIRFLTTQLKARINCPIQLSGKLERPGDGRCTRGHPRGAPFPRTWRKTRVRRISGSFSSSFQGDTFSPIRMQKAVARYSPILTVASFDFESGNIASFKNLVPPIRNPPVSNPWRRLIVSLWDRATRRQTASLLRVRSHHARVASSSAEQKKKADIRDPGRP